MLLLEETDIATRNAHDERSTGNKQTVALRLEAVCVDSVGKLSGKIQVTRPRHDRALATLVQEGVHAMIEHVNMTAASAKGQVVAVGLE